MAKIDYSQFQSRAQDAGYGQGKARGSLLRIQQDRERQELIKQRYEEMARNREAQANEIAKTEYKNAVKAQAEEAAAFNAAYNAGHIDQDGMYQMAYFEHLADKQRKASGVKYSSAEQEAWMNGGRAAEAENLKSGHAKGMQRFYKRGSLETVVNQQIDFNRQQREFDVQRQGNGGLFGSAMDAMFGAPEAPTAPETSYMAQNTGIQGRFEETARDPVKLTVDTASDNEYKPMTVEDATGNPVLASYDKKTGEYGRIGENGEFTPDNTLKPLSEHKKREDKAVATTAELSKAANPESVKKIQQGFTIIEISDKLMNLAATVEVGSDIVTGYAGLRGWFEKEFVGATAFFGGNEAQAKKFISDRFDESFMNGLNAEDRKELGYSPETVQNINRLSGELNSNRLTLAYLLVQANSAGPRRFSAQELTKQLEQLSAGNLPATLATLKSATKRANETMRNSAIDVAADIALHRAARGEADGLVGLTKPELVAMFTRIKRQDDKLFIDIGEKYRERFNARAIALTKSGGVLFYGDPETKLGEKQGPQDTSTPKTTVTTTQTTTEDKDDDELTSSWQRQIGGGLL